MADRIHWYVDERGSKPECRVMRRDIRTVLGNSTLPVLGIGLEKPTSLLEAFVPNPAELERLLGLSEGVMALSPKPRARPLAGDNEREFRYTWVFCDSGDWVRLRALNNGIGIGGGGGAGGGGGGPGGGGPGGGGRLKRRGRGAVGTGGFCGRVAGGGLDDDEGIALYAEGGDATAASKEVLGVRSSTTSAARLLMLPFAVDFVDLPLSLRFIPMSLRDLGLELGSETTVL